MEYLTIGTRQIEAKSDDKDHEIWIKFHDVKDILEEYNNMIHNTQVGINDWNLMQ